MAAPVPPSANQVLTLIPDARRQDYTAYLSKVAGFMGLATSDLQSDEEALLLGFFQRNIKEAWERGPWLDITPYGEARFVGNMLDGIIIGADWTVGEGIGDFYRNNIANPLDGRQTAYRISESTSNNTHNIAPPAVACVPDTQYKMVIFARPRDRFYCRLQASSSGTPTAYFALSDEGSVVSSSGCTATISGAPHGFYRCEILFTTGSTDASFSGLFSVSDNGARVVYAGASGSGLYLWGFYIGENTDAPRNSTVGWEQTGEMDIEAVYEVWEQSPFNLNMPRVARYGLVPEGIQLYGSNGAVFGWTPSLQGWTSNPPNPVYLKYRWRCPDFSGDDFDATATYAIDDQVYFEDSDGAGNFWKCVTATSAGQDPEDTPTKWQLLPIPDVLFEYVTWKGYSDWLLVEGQHAKSAAIAMRAEEALNSQWDREERQMGHVMRTKVTTHTSTQAR